MSSTEPNNLPSRILELDVELEVRRIEEMLERTILREFNRRGAIVGISGGIDSSVVLALCVRALGSQRVLGVALPERESSPEGLALAQGLSERLGVGMVVEDITQALEHVGCYHRRDEAIHHLVPVFGPGWKSKITLPGSLLEQETLNVFHLIVVGPDGMEVRIRIPPAEFSAITAASNLKQRLRMSMLYYHAELRSYAVVGTANKNEHDLGFFVKYGDGGADLNPIAHLFKSQVYQVAAYLGIPDMIRQRTPTTDTYSAGQTQEEFFFRVPFDVLDWIWAAHECNVPIEGISQGLGLTTEQVTRVIQDIVRKQRTTKYLRTSPVHLAP